VTDTELNNDAHPAAWGPNHPEGCPLCTVCAVCWRPRLRDAIDAEGVCTRCRRDE
jgi:hypothetical protein